MDENQKQPRSVDAVVEETNRLMTEQGEMIRNRDSEGYERTEKRHQELIVELREAQAAAEAAKDAKAVEEEWERRERTFRDRRPIAGVTDSIANLGPGGVGSIPSGVREEVSPELAEEFKRVARDFWGDGFEEDTRQTPSEEAFQSFMRTGITDGTRVRRVGIDGERVQRAANDAIGGGTGLAASAGAAIVPPDTRFFTRLITGVRAYMVPGNIFNTFTTANGRTLEVPYSDDTAAANDAKYQAENAVAQTTPRPAFSTPELRAYAAVTGVQKLTIQQVQDEGPPLMSWFPQMMGERIGKAMGAKCASGTGVNEPQGYLTGATTTIGLVWDRTPTSDQTNLQTDASQVAADVGPALFHSVDIGYRIGPGAALVVSDQFLRMLRSATGSDGHFVYPELRMIGRDGTTRFEGLKCVTDPNIAAGTVTSGTTPFDVGAVGDFKRFWHRKVRGVVMIRQDQFADELKVGYQTFIRHDSRLIDTRAIHKIRITPKA